MKNFLKSNTFLGIISVIIAISLWIYVAYVANPEYEKWINDVVVEPVGSTSQLEDGVLTIVSQEHTDLLKNGYKVSVKVRGKRNVVSSLENDDIKCKVDLSSVTDPDKKYDLTLKTECEIGGVEIVAVSKGEMIKDLRVDKIETKEFEIDFRIIGKLPLPGYELEKPIKLNPTYVSVTGPKSKLSNIESAVATLDCSTLSYEDTNRNIEVKLMDISGAEIDSNKFSSISSKTTQVSFKLYTEKEVVIKLVPRYEKDIKTNSSGDDVALYIYDADNDKKHRSLDIKVKLRGTKELIDKYSEEPQKVYTEPIDISEITRDGVLELTYKADTLGESGIDFVEGEIPVVHILAEIINEEEALKMHIPQLEDD